jgi:hypothetical protein
VDNDGNSPGINNNCHPDGFTSAVHSGGQVNIGGQWRAIGEVAKKWVNIPAKWPLGGSFGITYIFYCTDNADQTYQFRTRGKTGLNWHGTWGWVNNGNFAYSPPLSYNCPESHNGSNDPSTINLDEVTADLLSQASLLPGATGMNLYDTTVDYYYDPAQPPFDLFVQQPCIYYDKEDPQDPCSPHPSDGVPSGSEEPWTFGSHATHRDGSG